MAIPQGGVYDITIYQGADFTRTFAVRESDETTVVPLTGYTEGLSQIRRREGSDEIMGEFDVDIDEITGTVTITMEDTATAELTSDGAYDIFLTNSGTDDVIMLIEGQVTLNKRVSVEEGP